MDLKWLDDFLMLMETANFSKAAEVRNISQPAFSRRIQALEDWLGVRLVDRHRKPLQFTPVAIAFQAELRGVVNTVYGLRSQIRAEETGANRVVLAAQHTLATAFVPQLIRRLETAGFRYAYRLRSANKWDCVPLLLQGHAHFLVCYESAANPSRLSATTMSRLVVGQDRLRLVSSARDGAPVHDVFPGCPAAMLAYPQDSFLGQLLWEERLPQLTRVVNLQTICESAFALGLKEMALNGLGLAWLPESLIRGELAAGRLVALDHRAPPCDLEVVMYAARHAATPLVEEVWSFLART